MQTAVSRREFRYNLWGSNQWWAQWVIQTTVGIQSSQCTPPKTQNFNTKDEAVLWLKQEARANGVMGIPERIDPTKVWLPLGTMPPTHP